MSRWRFWLTAGTLLALTLAVEGSAETPAAAPEYPAKGLDVFDPRANGMELVDAAIKQARTDGRKVLLMFGANWCAWCHRLSAAFDSDPVLIEHFRKDFLLVKIDVNAKTGKQRNRDVVERFGKPTRLGLPVIVLLTADGAVQATKATREWEMPDGKSYRRTAILESFAGWARAAEAPKK